MPPAIIRKPFKTVCVDTVLFFAMFALVGHLTINYWERYTIQNELISMKRSLHALKDNIGNIGKAYDNLHTQMKGLIQEVDKKQIDTPECRLKEKIEAKCKAENNLNIKRRNIQVQTTVKKSSKMILDVPVETDNNKKSYVCEHTNNNKKSYSCEHTDNNKKSYSCEHTDNNKKSYGHEHKATGPQGINASTNTRNPPKSTGTITPSDISNDIGYVRKKTCFKDFDDNRSGHVCHSVGTTGRRDTY